MMKYYSIKDIKVGFMNLIPMHNDDEAKRTFKVALDNPQGIFKTSPEDLELWRVAEFDESTGSITESKEFICNASTFGG